MKVAVIGSGFAGLSAASFLAKKGFDVTIFEKNSQPGGRARSFEAQGFKFDMGPSWYWMPDVFDRYFDSFNKKVTDYYTLQQLDPSYRVYFGANDYLDLPAGMDNCIALFEQIEKGAGSKLRKFLSESAYKYEVGIKDLVFKPGRSLLEFADLRIAKGLFQLDLLKSMRSYVHAHFTNSKLRQIVEFPILFLGATPNNTPALYSLMNYADMALGTWFPKGGMHKIVEGMVSLAKELGVVLELDTEVKQIEVEHGQIKGIITHKGFQDFDIVVGSADYNHVEQKLLKQPYRQYSKKYWNSRAMAPSSLLFYLGLSKKIKGLLHHTLFFDEDFDQHAHEIYEEPKWPSKPLFYVSVTSKTDLEAAPKGKENVFLLMPLAPNLKDAEENREKYYHLMMDRLQKHLGEDLRPFVEYKRGYAHKDFVEDYNAFKGNAYGLANTLKQTAILKPRLKSKKVENLYFTGQLTTPGPGVPPSLISGEVVAGEIEKDLRKTVTT
jgi:phytoene desaturase